MTQAGLRALLDAKVLYPFALRDTLLLAAEAGLYQICWSEEILEETRRNLVKSADVPEDKANHLIDIMQEAFPEALVDASPTLAADLENDPKDRHVVATAIAGEASVIVTQNLKDFEPTPDGIEAVHPDEFLLRLLAADEPTLLEVLRKQAEKLQNPPVNLDELLGGLERFVPGFIGAAREGFAQGRG